MASPITSRDRKGAGWLEEFTCRARVLRHQTVDGGAFALALQFLHPLDLMLEV